MAGRSSAKGQQLPFLTDQAFEDETALLLTEYGNKHDQGIGPPVPIDDIVELHLELALEFIDTRARFGVDDIHGALWVRKRLVGIDHRLDPGTNPAMLGRYRFTLAHEAGHWRLHRHLFQKPANQLTLLRENAERPEYICRSGSTEPIEYQANRFASCLLMPKEMMKRAWSEWRADMAPIYLTDLRAGTSRKVPDDLMLENAVRPLAETFEVSPEAMRIRCEGMGLLLRKKEALLF